jgi:hypothetical protein
LTYAEDLKHPLWQQRRLRVLERANWTCQRCGSVDRQLHAHHKVYLRGHRLWDYPDDLLECLCERCHDLAHAQKSRLDLLVAQHPTAALPAINRLVDKLGAVMAANSPAQRIDARNRLQDELDAIEDFKRGAGEFAEQPLETTA